MTKYISRCLLATFLLFNITQVHCSWFSWLGLGEDKHQKFVRCQCISYMKKATKKELQRSDLPQEAISPLSQSDAALNAAYEKYGCGDTQENQDELAHQVRQALQGSNESVITRKDIINIFTQAVIDSLPNSPEKTDATIAELSARISAPAHTSEGMYTNRILDEIFDFETKRTPKNII